MLRLEARKIQRKAVATGLLSLSGAQKQCLWSMITEKQKSMADCSHSGLAAVACGRGEIDLLHA